MRAYIKIISFIVGSLSFFISCSDDNDNNDATSIKIQGLDSDTITLRKEQTLQLNIETDPIGKPFKLMNSDPYVYSISDEGIITGKNIGTAALYIMSINGDTYIKKRYIIDVITFVDSIGVNDDAKGLNILQKNEQKNAYNYFTAYPENAKYRTMLFTSSDPSVLTIDEKGNINLVSSGVASIIAKAEHRLEGVKDIVSAPVRIYVINKISELDKSQWTPIGNTYYNGFEIEKIIDGSDETVWIGNGRLPESVMIDMKAPRSFNRLKFRKYGRYSAYTKDVDIYISTNISDGLSLNDPSFNKISTIKFGDYFESLSAPSKTIDFWIDNNSITSRYIKFTFPNSNYNTFVTFSEIYLYNIEN